MAINDKLNRIKEIKGNIKDAIVEKGVEVTDSDSFNSYADKIRAISGGGGTPDKPTPPETPKFVKPDDWIDIREGIPENAIRYLISDKCFSDANEYDVSEMLIDDRNLCGFTINWGDGTSFVVEKGDIIVSIAHKFDKTKRHLYKDEYGFEHGQYMVEIISNDPTIRNASFYGQKVVGSILWCVNNLSGIQNIDCTDYSSLICYELINSHKISNIDFYGCSSLPYLDVSNWDVSSVTDMYEVFNKCESLTYLDVSNWDVSSVTDMRGMFSNCRSLSYLDVSNWDVSSVTNMNNIFNKCESLTYLDVSNWDVSSVTDMRSMFYCCYSLPYLDVSNWDVSSVTNMHAMFNMCYSLPYLDVSNWDVSSVTDMGGMFNKCRSLTELDVSNWDVSSVTNTYSSLSLVAGGIFTGCESLTYLDVSNWDVSNMSSMRAIFKGCTMLNSLDVSNWDVSRATTMEEMFCECKSLKSLDVTSFGLDNPRDINMKNLFSYCENLETIGNEKVDLSHISGIDYSFNASGMFSCTYKIRVLDITFQDSADTSYSFYLPLPLDNSSNLRGLVDFSLTIPRPTFKNKIEINSSPDNNTLQRLIIKGQDEMTFTASSPQINLQKTVAFKEEQINEFFSNLPTATNSPTISLKGNPHAQRANMGIALEKGWNVMYDSSANSASTTPLGDDETPTNLPLAYRFIPGEDGTFVDANGNKCNLLYSQSVATMNPTGWEMLPTFEDALNKYGIEVEEEYREEIAKEVLAYANDDSLIKRYNIELD